MPQSLLACDNCYRVSTAVVTGGLWGLFALWLVLLVVTLKVIDRRWGWQVLGWRKLTLVGLVVSVVLQLWGFVLPWLGVEPNGIICGSARHAYGHRTYERGPYDEYGCYASARERIRLGRELQGAASLLVVGVAVSAYIRTRSEEPDGSITEPVR